MNKNEKQLFNIEELVNNIAQDIAKFSEGVSKAKITRDLRTMDISSVMPAAGKSAIKGAIGQARAEGEKISQQHQKQIQIQSEALEEAIKTRQENMKINLSKIQKAEPEAKASGSGKIVEMRVGESIKSYDRNIEELHIRKTGSPENIWIEAEVSVEMKAPAGEEVTGALTKLDLSKKIKPT